MEVVTTQEEELKKIIDQLLESHTKQELQELFRKIEDEKWKKEARDKWGRKHGETGLTKKEDYPRIFLEAVKEKKIDLKVLEQAVNEKKKKKEGTQTKRKRAIQEVEEIPEKINQLVTEKVNQAKQEALEQFDQHFAKRFRQELDHHLAQLSSKEVLDFFAYMALKAFEFSFKCWDLLEANRKEIEDWCDSNKVKLPEAFKMDEKVYSAIEDLNELEKTHPLAECRDKVILAKYLTLSNSLYEATKKQLTNMLQNGFENIKAAAKQVKALQEQLIKDQERIKELEEECERLRATIEKMKIEQEEVVRASY